MQHQVELDIAKIIRGLAKDCSVSLTDVSYVIRRYKNEGLHFLTKTLPTYAAFALYCVENSDKSFKENKIAFGNPLINSFSWSRSSPQFLKVHFNELSNGSADSLYNIRQFCDYFYKTCFGYSGDELTAACEKFVSTDEVVGELLLDGETVGECRKAFSKLFPRLRDLTPIDFMSIGRAKDGPGSTARSNVLTRRHNCHIAEFKSLPFESIGSHPRRFNAFSGHFRSFPGSHEKLKAVNNDNTCQVRFVPKDSRGPRVISKEPYHLMRIQMIGNSVLTRYLERESKRHVNFESQEYNRHLSLLSSIDRKLATLDLKDASDRVSYQLVKKLFAGFSGLTYMVTRTRSTHAELPNGDTIKLNKFANMGSGLCFPVLSLVVYLAGVVGCKRYYAHLSYEDCAKLVYVYGDDLIVPCNAVSSVRLVMTQLGLILNDKKCYVKGNFRESCGADYYNGKDVGPVRLRLSNAGLSTVHQYGSRRIPIASDAGVLQLERHCRELFTKGLYTLQAYYNSLLKSALGTFPIVDIGSPVLGQVSTELPLQVPQSGFVPVTPFNRFDRACGWKILGRSLTSELGIQQDPYHISLRGTVKLKFKRKIEPSVVCNYGITTVFT